MLTTFKLKPSSPNNVSNLKILEQTIISGYQGRSDKLDKLGGKEQQPISMRQMIMRSHVFPAPALYNGSLKHKKRLLQKNSRPQIIWG